MNISPEGTILTNQAAKCFIVDISERKLVLLTGPDGQDLLHRLSTNDISKLTIGSSMQTILTNEKGRIIELISVIKLTEQSLLLVGHSSETDKLIRWLDKFIIMEDAKVESQTEVYTHFLLYGFDEGAEEPFPLSKDLQKDVLVVKERWKNSSHIHLLIEKAKSDLLLQYIQSVSFKWGSKEHFEQYRVRSLIPASPNELSEEYNPLEANLNDFISWTKGCYIGQEVIARLDTYKKVQRHLVKLKLEDLPASLPQSIFHENEEVGTITSAAKVSTSEYSALGYIKTNFLDSGARCFTVTGERQISVTLEKEPTA